MDIPCSLPDGSYRVCSFIYPQPSSVRTPWRGTKEERSKPLVVVSFRQSGSHQGRYRHWGPDDEWFLSRAPSHK